MTLYKFYQRLYRRNSMLAVLGLLHLGIGLALLVVALLDTQQVLGINRWIKPIKFLFSTFLFAWTAGWLLFYLKDTHPRSIRVISGATSLTMVVENFCITVQAARGTTSHFNVESMAGSLIFMVMGIFILLNTFLVMYATWLFFRTAPPIPRSYLWGIRLGFVLFVVGSAVGGVMSVLLTHAVGVPMGGEGLPLVNWSTKGGDLRIAHFLGLHALQIVPLVGLLLARYAPKTSDFRLVSYTIGFAFLYGGATAGLYWQAMQGTPFLGD